MSSGSAGSAGSGGSAGNQSTMSAAGGSEPSAAGAAAGTAGSSAAGASGGAGGAGASGGAGGAGGQDAGLPGVEVTLKSGQKRQGQLIATYDHSIWWSNPSPEKTLAIFDPAKFADYPDDHSMEFLSSFNIETVIDITLPAGTEAYRDMLRKKGIVIQQLPVPAPLYIAGGNGGYHSEENGTGDFAWDIVKANDDGTHFKGTGAANEDYLIWDAPLTLPIGGEVIEVIRDAPDNVPGEYGLDSPNNMVGVHVGGQFYLFLLHMRQNTIPDSVKEGAKLPAGADIGRVGNSGASIEPHLHIALVWYDTVTQRSWAAPSEWANVWSSSSASGPAKKHDYIVPEAGTWISSDMF
jgi:hypothetical protein